MTDNTETLDQLSGPLMKNKKGLIMGVANNHSLAWGIAKNLNKHGASLAFTYQGESFRKRVEPLAKSVSSDLLFDCDVTNKDQIESTFSSLSQEWGGIDFIVHGIAYSDRNELTGRYIDTSKENFLKTLEISCFSLTDVSKIAEPFMNEGGSILTLSFGGSLKVMPNYNVMGVAKAALETSVKYLSVDLGDQNVRVNAISAGPMRTIAGAAIANARNVFNYTSENSSLKRNVNLDELGNSALYLVSDLSSAITGEIHYVDCGFNIVGMPKS